MTGPNVGEEPLKNVDLESAILGLRMTLSPEEEVEARTEFLDLVRRCTLAVPTIEPVPTYPNGAMMPNAQINFLVVNTAEGATGIPGFTTLGGLRTALPQFQNLIFLSGADLANILGQSGHKLFIEGPDLHAEVEPVELQQMAFVAQQYVAAQQQAALHNPRLEEALELLGTTDNRENEEAAIKAFLEGFCSYPVLGEGDQDSEALVLSQEAPQGGPVMQEVALLTLQGALPAFTSEERARSWDQNPRGLLPLPGQMVAQLASQAEVTTILLNPGSESTQTIYVRQGQLSLHS